MNLVPLVLTVFLVVFVVGTIFWMTSTLSPIRKKQAMRKAQRLEESENQGEKDREQ
ncbi:hypothetical protein [Congregibacter sp.]|uniref:hypothetical protein n=1 Tax=Congregibacter sp. TaxID=2744308 RepID=UPI00385D1846